jgi:hypothetical protein
VIWSAGRVLAKVSKRSRLLLVQVLAVLVFGLFNNPFQPFVVLILGLSWVGLFFKLDRNL